MTIRVLAYKTRTALRAKPRPQADNPELAKAVWGLGSAAMIMFEVRLLYIF